MIIEHDKEISRIILEPLIEEFENLPILGSKEKKAGYEAAMKTAAAYLKAALVTTQGRS